MWFMFKNKRIAALLVLLCMLLTACQASVPDDNLISDEMIVPEEIKYKTTEVTVGDYEKVSQGSLSLKYPVTEQLKVEATGQVTVKAIHVKSMQNVKAGTVLAEFEVKIDEAALAELNLKLERAKEAFRTGKQTRQDNIDNAKKKTEGLTSHELKIAQLNLEKQQVEYEQYVYQTQKSIAAIEEDIAEIYANARKKYIVAPFDGVVESVASLAVDERVSTGKVIVTLRSTDEFYLLAESSGTKLRYNMNVTIEAGKKDEKLEFSGRVVSAPNALPITLAQSSAIIHIESGVSHTVLKNTPIYRSIEESVKNVLLVDRSALGKDDNGDFVYILGNDVIQKRYVLRGLNNTEHFWIMDGLTEGQSIILN